MSDDFVGTFASGMFRLVFRDLGLGRKLKAGPKKVQEAAWIAASSMAPEVENYAKLNAPWTDQTSNARNGLAARAYRQGDGVGIVIYHQVSYGIWLEIRWNGKYAIINPTIDAMGPLVMRRLERLMERI